MHAAPRFEETGSAPQAAPASAPPQNEQDMRQKRRFTGLFSTAE